MQNEFLPYNRALKLKELGLDEPCFARFNNDGDLLIAHTEKYIIDNGVDRSEFFTLAPLFQQAFRWFREEHGLGHMINGIGYESFLFNIGGLVTVFPMFKTYEEAELACLDKLIEIVELKNKDNEL